MNSIDEKVTIITADDSSVGYFKNIWNYRELFLFFIMRDLIIRYKETTVGLMWVILRPILVVCALLFVFGKFCKLESTHSFYLLLIFAAVLPWQFFSSAITESNNGITQNTNLITKVYFPRAIIPLSIFFICLIEFLIGFSLISVLYIWSNQWPPIQVFALPFFLALLSLFILGVILFVTTLNLKYRDFKYVIPFAVQFGLFISPVGYSIELVPNDWRFVYSLNPLVGIMEGFRYCLISNYSLSTTSVFISTIMVIIVFFIGLKYFQKNENHFADLI